MKWIKEKIKQWIREEVLKDEIEKMNLARSSYNRASCLCEESLTNNKEIQKMVNEITDVGVDVGYYNDSSWAVVCMAGKPEYVKFMPLTGEDARTVIEFLKHFKYSNCVVDSPFGFKNLIRNHI